MSDPHTLHAKPEVQQMPIVEQFDDSNRVLSDSSPREKYQRRVNQDKTTYHFDQRKLLISEIEFLTNFVLSSEFNADKKHVVIYAGAAPGIHIAFLISLFPFFEYVLVDPAEFKLDDTKHNGKVTTINDFFDDNMARRFSKQFPMDDYEILFISDIRSANYRQETRTTTERKVEEDMVQQMNWHKIMRPIKSMFKFRLPYVGDETDCKTEIDYLEGKVYLQVWEGKTSSETRLVVDRDAKVKHYDCVEYEDQLFRFNTVERVRRYKHDVDVPGFDHCYDCRAEIYVLENYLRAQNKCAEVTKQQGKQLMKEFSDIKGMISTINDLLNAHNRVSMLTYLGKNYKINFLDIRFGVDLSRLFHPSKLVYSFVADGCEDGVYGDRGDEKYFQAFDECQSIHALQNKQTCCDFIEESDFSKLRKIDPSSESSQDELTSLRCKDRSAVDYRERGVFLDLVEFLTISCQSIAESPLLKFRKIVLVYMGALKLRGSLSLLQEMFPFVHFIFYDPRWPLEEISTPSNIQVKREALNEDICLQLKEEFNDQVLLFASNAKGCKLDENGLKIESEDLSFQKTCFVNLKPFRAMLRFRLNCSKENGLKYLDGQQFVRLWSNKHIETNLVVQEIAYSFENLREYDVRKFKTQIETVLKRKKMTQYGHPELKSGQMNGLDCCYDCRGEVHVLESYLANRLVLEKINKDKMEIFDKKLNDLVEALNKSLDAKNKGIFFTFNGQTFHVKFTEVKFGKKFIEICNEKTVQRLFKRKFDEASDRSLVKHQNYSVPENLANRLDFSQKNARNQNNYYRGNSRFYSRSNQASDHYHSERGSYVSKNNFNRFYNNNKTFNHRSNQASYGETESYSANNMLKRSYDDKERDKSPNSKKQRKSDRKS